MWAIFRAFITSASVKETAGFWWGDLRERDHLEGPDVYGKIILKRIFKK